MALLGPQGCRVLTPRGLRRVAWPGPDRGRTAACGPGERLALPNFQEFAYDKSRPQILWGFPCLWFIHPLESVALELFRHYFSRGFPRPSNHAVSGTRGPSPLTGLQCQRCGSIFPVSFPCCSPWEALSFFLQFTHTFFYRFSSFLSLLTH